MTLYRDILDPSRTVTVTNTDIARWSPLDWDQREIHAHGSEEREAENHAQSEKLGWGRKDIPYVARAEKLTETLDDTIKARDLLEGVLHAMQNQLQQTPDPTGVYEGEIQDVVRQLIRMNRAIYRMEQEEQAILSPQSLRDKQQNAQFATDPKDKDSRLAEGFNPKDCDPRDQLSAQIPTHREDEGTHQLEISGVRTVAPSNEREQIHRIGVDKNSPARGHHRRADGRAKHDELRGFINAQLTQLGQDPSNPIIRAWIRKHTPYQIINALQRRINPDLVV